MKDQIELWEKYIELASKKDVISFSSGRPGQDFFHLSLLKLKKIIQNVSSDINSYDYSDQTGISDLRKLIYRKYLSENVNLTSDKIIITSGAQQAIEIVFKSILKKNDKVLTVNKNYINIQLPVANTGAKIVTFQNDINENKLELIIKKTKPKILYIIPDFANPDGKNFSLKIRQKIALLAKKLRFIIVEDQTYRDLYFDKKNLITPIKKFASENTIIVSTISKTIVPSLRIGWIITPKKYFPVFLKQKKAADLFTSTFNQLVVRDFMENQHNFELFMNKVRKHYQKKMTILNCSLRKYFPKEFTWDKTDGGFFVWIKGPVNFDSKAMFDKALRKKVSFIPGCVFCLGKVEKNSFRLSVSATAENQIEEGIIRLAEVLEKKTIIRKRKLIPGFWAKFNFKS